MKLSLKVCILNFASHFFLVTQAVSFIQAISTYPQLSNFTSLLISNPGLAEPFYSVSYSAPQTVLVPDDNAFLNFQEVTGQSFADQPYNYLQNIINYQLLNGNLTFQDILHPAGLTIPTGLTGPTYNNRTAGSVLISSSASTGNHNGQVVFIAPNTTSTRFSPRQLGSTGAYVQSGLGHQVNLTAIDGIWDGGMFQIIDGFLTLPEICTQTIRAWGLKSLDFSLNRTGLSSVLDHINNVTCLGPNDQAFLQAGSPDVKDNVTELASEYLALHTIPQPLYSNFLQDGQTFMSLSNNTIRVTIQDGSIYFNDAKAIQLNVLTNNGLMHVLDRIMSPLDSTSASPSTTESSSPTATMTGTATPSSTNKSSSASRGLALEPSGWRMFEVLGFIYSYIFLIL